MQHLLGDWLQPYNRTPAPAPGYNRTTVQPYTAGRPRESLTLAALATTPTTPAAALPAQYDWQRSAVAASTRFQRPHRAPRQTWTVCPRAHWWMRRSLTAHWVPPVGRFLVATGFDVALFQPQLAAYVDPRTPKLPGTPNRRRAVLANHTGLPTAATRWSHSYRAGDLRAVDHATSTVVHRYRRLATLQPVVTATRGVYAGCRRCSTSKSV